MTIRLDYLSFSPSPHKSPRKNNQKPTYLVIHSMIGTMEGSLSWFKNPTSKVSAHYLVSKQGEIVCAVKPELAAWHCKNFNSMSIGIEFEDLNPKTKKNSMNDPKWFTPAQLDKGAELVATLMLRYKIPLDHVIGHNDKMLAAPPYNNDHKDPGPYWPWEEFRALVKKHLQPPKEPKNG